MSLSEGTRLGAYEIKGQIGAGGMGEVYRATDTKLGRDVAIKILPATLASDKDRLARFEREAKLLASLNHAHIASVHSLDEADGTVYIAMELVAGETLEEKLKSGSLPVEDALQLALQIALALEAAHEKGVVHRDLKPANVMITPDEVVKVLDFGLAKAFSGDPNSATAAHSPALSLAMTQQGLVLGTAGYMSPEQASGQATDQRADVWAFGVVLYEMLTGQPLFSGESVPHILAAVLQNQPDWARLPKNLHPRLRHTLRRCLEKKIRNRYHSIADARIDIEEVLNDPTSTLVGNELHGAGADGDAYSRGPAWRRSLPWVAGVALAALAGYVAWTAKPEDSVGVVRIAHDLPASTIFRAPERPIVAISPDGTKFVYNTLDGLYLHSLNSFEDQLIPGTDRWTSYPVFSPDGQWLAYIGDSASVRSAQLQKIQVGGGAPVAITDVPNNPTGISWEEDGTIIYSLPDAVMRVSENGGEPETLIDTSAVGALGASLLPGGDAILFYSLNQQVMVWRFGEDQPVPLVQGQRPRYLDTGHLVFFDGGVLYAVPFDTDGRKITGGRVPMEEGIRPTPPQYDVSDSGTLVWIPGTVADAQQDRALALVDKNGTVQPIDLPPAPYQSPRLDPDGERLAVEILGADGQSNIWIYDLSGRFQIRQLTRGGNNTRPIWTPDGQRVTFASDRDGYGIWWQMADFSAPAERLTTSDVDEHWPGSWHPDGQILAITTSIPGGGGSALGISTYSRETEEVTVFYDLTDSNQESPAFSPNGEWLAYSSFEPGTQSSQVFIQPFPPTDTVHPVTTSGEAHPIWSRDGTQLFFRRSIAAQPEPAISFVTITTTPAVNFEQQQTLPIDNFVVVAAERSFDLMPDAEQLLITLPASAANPSQAPTPQISVVVNWFDELTARVPTN